MNKKNCITITGDLGAGKSTIAKILCDALQFKSLVIGNLFKEESVKRNIPFHELMVLIKTDPTVDNAIDEMQRKYLLDNDEYVVDSRLGKFFEPRSFGVFVSVDPRIGAERIWNALKTDPTRLAESGSASVEDLMEKNKLRVESERTRYLNLYHYDQTDRHFFDLVVNTDFAQPEDVAEQIVKAFEDWKNN